MVAIKEKHKFACLLRDGCDGQIRAGPKISAYNESLGRHIITGKYSAGCSMTQSLNDGGHGHDGLHGLFENKNFKMRPYGDPAGSTYSALKDFLKQYLNPASFKTYWAFMCAMEPYVKKAINPIVVKSAAKKSGFEGSKINVRTIMSYNPEYARLPDEKAEEVVNLITTVLGPYFRDNQWIPETMYPDLFPVDNGFNFTISVRTGTPLNNLGTNRQRFMVDNSVQWIAVLADRKAVVLAAEEEKERKRLAKLAVDLARPKKTRSCSMLGCHSEIDVTTSALKKANEGTWKKCMGKKCSAWACPFHFGQLQEHELTCAKCST